MDNYSKIVTIKINSKNFTGKKGRETYSKAHDFLDKIRADEDFQNSPEVESFLQRNKNLLPK